MKHDTIIAINKAIFYASVVKNVVRSKERAQKQSFLRSFHWCGRWDLNQNSVGCTMNFRYLCVVKRRFYGFPLLVRNGRKPAKTWMCGQKCGHAFRRTLRNTPLTAWAVISASPVRVWLYMPNVSMSSLWPTNGLISPAGNVLTTLTNVWRSS